MKWIEKEGRGNPLRPEGKAWGVGEKNLIPSPTGLEGRDGNLVMKKRVSLHTHKKEPSGGGTPLSPAITMLDKQAIPGDLGAVLPPVTNL